MENVNIMDSSYLDLKLILQNVLASIKDEQEYKIEELLAYITNLGFTIKNVDEVKNYILKDKVLLANIKYVCERIKNKFPEVNSFTIKFHKDLEDSAFDSLYIVFNSSQNNNKEFNQELFKKVEELYKDHVFSFLGHCKSFVDIYENGDPDEL